MPYFDSHCHLAMDQFDPDRPEVIALCQQAGVGMLTVGVDVGSSRAGIDLARRHPGVWAGVGVHPCDCLDLGEEDWQTLQDLARLPEVVAVGETGLDNHWRAVPLERQAYWFR
ncbi:MAG: TatD family hydrolase, partial [Planctomycetota bacterium]|nr:TatD family hydrolase [Planctomycetota bacterium]